MLIKIRADKFLWCIRLFKTRVLSNEACCRSKVKINNTTIKSSYIIKVGDVLKIKKKMIYITIRVKDTLDKRVSPKLVESYIEDITPESEIVKLKASLKIPRRYREKGSGRPTKKKRRDMMKELKNYFES